MRQNFDTEIFQKTQQFFIVKIWVIIKDWISNVCYPTFYHTILLLLKNPRKCYPAIFASQNVPKNKFAFFGLEN
jgi:hypothetical protein